MILGMCFYKRHFVHMSMMLPLVSGSFHSAGLISVQGELLRDAVAQHRPQAVKCFADTKPCS